MVVSFPGEARAQRPDICESDPAQIRKLQFSLLGNITESVASRVAVLPGVGHFADANAVEDDPDNTLESRFHFLMVCRGRPWTGPGGEYETRVSRGGMACLPVS